MQSLGRTVAAVADRPILDSLLAAGLDYPHGCTTGLCSLCKSRLISGQIEHLEYFESALAPQERDAGLFLPCSSKPRGDCIITPVQQDAMMPAVQSLTGRVVAVEALTHDICRIAVVPDDDRRFEFLPGQYAQVSFGPHPARDFSMASPPGATTVEFFVRRLTDGRVTRDIDRDAVADTRVSLRGPYGNAYLREAHVGPIVAIAGGSGLAPILSIVQSAVQRGMRQPIRVYVGVRSERDVYLEHQLRALAMRHPNVSTTIVLSEPPATTHRRTGLVHESLRSDLATMPPTDATAYIAGPPPMVDAVKNVLIAAGLPSARCFVDPFLTEADRARMRSAA